MGRERGAGVWFSTLAAKWNHLRADACSHPQAEILIGSLGIIGDLKKILPG